MKKDIIAFVNNVEFCSYLSVDLLFELKLKMCL